MIVNNHPQITESPLSVILQSSVSPFVRISSRSEGHQIESIYQRRRSELKFPIHSCDSRHWEHTRRLEKWHSGHQKTKLSSTDLKSLQSNVLTFYCESVHFVFINSVNKSKHCLGSFEVQLLYFCCIHTVFKLIFTKLSLTSRLTILKVFMSSVSWTNKYITNKCNSVLLYTCPQT